MCLGFTGAGGETNVVTIGKNHRKTIGKWWFYGILWDLPSGVIKHGWLENPRTEWRFHRKIMNKWSIFQHAMFDCQGNSHGIPIFWILLEGMNVA